VQHACRDSDESQLGDGEEDGDASSCEVDGAVRVVGGFGVVEGVGDELDWLVVRLRLI